MEYAEYVDLNKLGAVTTKALPMYRGRVIRHRVLQKPTAAWINAIGLQNPGTGYVYFKRYSFLSSMIQRLLSMSVEKQRKIMSMRWKS